MQELVNICNSCHILLKFESMKAEKALSADYLPVLSNTECNSIELCAVLSWNLFHIPHCSWATASGEEEEWNVENLFWHFPCTGACSGRRKVSAVWYVVWTFSSPVLFAAFKPYRTLALLSIVLRDTSNHDHPYINSTIVLSDNTKGPYHPSQQLHANEFIL